MSQVLNLMITQDHITQGSAPGSIVKGFQPKLITPNAALK